MELKNAVKIALIKGIKFKRPKWHYWIKLIEGELRFHAMSGRYWFDLEDLMADDYIIEHSEEAQESQSNA